MNMQNVMGALGRDLDARADDKHGADLAASVFPAAAQPPTLRDIVGRESRSCPI